MVKPSYVGFEHDKYLWKPDIDYRENPHLYKIGRGQQGVLICQPYKSELHQYWRFKTPEKHRSILYLRYIKCFYNIWIMMSSLVTYVKKYLHMGFTRSRRYWNHSSGKKWTKEEMMVLNLMNGKYYRMIELKKDFMILV